MLKSHRNRRVMQALLTHKNFGFAWVYAKDSDYVAHFFILKHSSSGCITIFYKYNLPNYSSDSRTAIASHELLQPSITIMIVIFTSNLKSRPWPNANITETRLKRPMDYFISLSYNKLDPTGPLLRHRHYPNMLRSAIDICFWILKLEISRFSEKT